VAAIHAEGSEWFDPQEAVTRERLDGLVATHDRAAQNPLDQVVLQAQHQPFGLVEPGGRQGPFRVRPSQLPLAPASPWRTRNVIMGLPLPVKARGSTRGAVTAPPTVSKRLSM
jgi:hypothetical protein